MSIRPKEVSISTKFGL